MSLLLLLILLLHPWLLLILPPTPVAAMVLVAAAHNFRALSLLLVYIMYMLSSFSRNVLQTLTADYFRLGTMTDKLKEAYL